MSLVPSLGANAPDPAILRAIDTESSSMPGLFRTAAELREAAASLVNRRKPIAAAAPGQQPVAVVPRPAHLVDVESLSKGLAPLEAYKTAITPLASPSPPPQRRALHETIRAEVLDISIRALREDAEVRVGKSLDADWENLKSRVMQEFKDTTKPVFTSHTGPAPSTDTAAPPMTLGPLAEPAGVTVVRKEETPKMLGFYEVMRRFMEDTNPEKSYFRLCDTLKQAAAEVGSNADACEFWGLVRELVDAKSRMERYRGMGSKEFQRALAARQFLESQYRDKRWGMEHVDLIWDKLKGKNSSMYAKFYELCRCGYWESASQHAMRMGDTVLGDVLRKCADMSYAQPYPVSQATADEYQLALSDLMAGNGRPNLMQTVEDFIWVRLCKVTLHDDSGEAVSRSLEGLVNEITALGPQHFDETLSNPFLYARILASCTGLEQAIDYLAQGFSPLATSVQVNSAVADPLPDAAHLAIVLAHLGVLNIPTDNEDTIANRLLDQKGKQLALSRLLSLYASRFSDPVKAMFYATCLPRGTLVDDRAAKRILTGPLPSGGPLPLLKVLKFNLGDDAASTAHGASKTRAVRPSEIVLAAAKESRPADGISIYYEALKDDLFPDQRSRMVGEALKLLSKELAAVMGLEAANKERTFWKAEAERFNKQITPTSSAEYKLFSQVTECVKFYDRYLKGDEDSPVEPLVWLLPASNEPSLVQSRAAAFFDLHPIILDAFPRIISAVLECHMAAFKKGKQDEARQRMAGLMAFIAALKDEGYRLRSDVEREMNVCDSRIRA